MLAFDRDRVLRLRNCLRMATDALRAVSSAEPLAADAVALATGIRLALLDWDERLTRVTTSTVLEDGLDGAGLAPEEFGALLAAAGGWALAGCSPGDEVPLSDATIAALVARLDDRAAAVAVVQLAAARADRITGRATDGMDVETLDQLLAVVARALGPLPDDRCGRAESVLSGLAPEPAVLLLSHLAAQGAGTPFVLARLAVVVLSRWLGAHAPGVALQHPESWPVAAPADELFAALAASPPAARAFVETALGHDDGLLLVTGTAGDPAAGTALIVAAVAPATCPVANAGTIVRAWTSHVLDGDPAPGQPYDTRWTDGLGEVVAPWLLQMTSRAADWRWDERTATSELARILHDADAMAALLAARQRAEAGVSTLVDVGDLSATEHALDDLAGMLGHLDVLLEREEVDDEVAQRLLWDVSWSVAGSATSAALGSVVPSGVTRRTASAAAAGLLGRWRTGAERTGWWVAPRPVAWVVADGAARHDWRRATLAAATAAATFEGLRATGWVAPDAVAPPPPPDAPGPPDGSSATPCQSARWRQQFESWLDALDRADPALDPSARLVLHDAVSTMLNPYQAAEACAQQSS